MKNLIFLASLILGFVSNAQNEMPQAQKDFIWVLRVKAVEDFKKNQNVSPEVLADLKKHFNLAKGEQFQDFNLQFYLDRDVENSDFKQKLSGLYQALLSSDSKEFERILSELSAPKVKEQEPERIVKPKNELSSSLPKISLDPRIPGFAEDPCLKLGTPAARRKCMEQNAKFQASRIVLDPGHFGGEYSDGSILQDGRETSKGYREGYGTFITALITKWCLENCFGAKSQNILLTRWDLKALGHDQISNTAVRTKKRELPKGENESAASDSMAYRSEYIRGLNPNLFISLHTNASGQAKGSVQRVEVFHLRNPSVRNDKAFEKSMEAYNNSVKLAQALESGFEESFGTTADPTGLNRKSVLKFSGSIETRSKETDYRVFKSMLLQGSPDVKKTPMVLVEGFFHDTLEDELVEVQKSTSKDLPKVQLGDQKYNFHRAHQWYAEAVVAGIARFYGCAERGTPKASGDGTH